jgi:NlpC/P60 family
MKSAHPDDLRDAAMFVYESMLNIPYVWGGDDPLAGVDCSGLVQEGTRSVGITERQVDYTAHALLHEKFRDLPRATIESELKRGMLVFWNGADGRVRHVEIVWAVWVLQGGRQLVLTIGASGGGSRTVDRAEAIAQNAYVKIRRITPGWVAAVDPFTRWPSA